MIIGNFKITNKHLDLEVIQWNEDQEIEQLQNFDIGLYPLPKNSWVSGKSGLKAMQYMAIGIPAVCSAVGNVLTFIDHGKNGVLVFEKDQWLSALSDLIDDVDKRKNIGIKAREKFIQEFSQDAIFKKYLNLIES